MTLPANGQLSLIQCVPASSCVATLASSPNRSPVSARAASGAARSAAARTSFFTMGLRGGPYFIGPPHGGGGPLFFAGPQNPPPPPPHPSPPAPPPPPHPPRPLDS